MVAGRMYPFERFSAPAKRVLTLAQEEAERSHHSYIGVEHILLGLLRVEEGVAAKALAGLGVEIDGVRRTIESVLGRNQRIIIRQIIPTSRVKKVIELSFEEARRMGDTHVGTEHLLLGLLLDGEGIAAHVLVDLDAGLERVRGEIARLAGSGYREERGGAPAASPSFGLSVLGRAAEILGAPQPAPPTRGEREELRRLLSELEGVERRWAAGADTPVAAEDEPGPDEGAP